MKRIYLFGLMLLVIVMGTISFAFCTSLEFKNGVGVLDSITIDVSEVDIMP